MDSFAKKAARAYFVNHPNNSGNDPIAKTARLVLDGGSVSPADREQLFQAVGWQKSGARNIKRTVSAMQNVQNKFAQYSLQWDVLNSTNASTGSKIRITQMIMGDMEKLLRTKFMKNITTSVAKTLGTNPAFAMGILKSVGRGLKMAAPVAELMVMAIDATERYIENKRLRARSEVDMFNRAAELKIDEKLAKRWRNQIQSSAEGADGTIGYALKWWGKGKSIDEEAKERYDQLTKSLSDARKNMGALGYRDANILSDYANSLGINVSELTERQRNKALDDTVIAQYDPDKFLNDPRVRSRIEHDILDTDIRTRYDKAAREKYFASTEYASQQRIYAEKLVKETIAAAIQKQKDLEEGAERAKEKMSAAEIWQRSKAMKDGITNFNGYRQRHSTWSIN